MVIAIYKNNSKASPERIRVHKYASDGSLHVEAITSSYAQEVGGTYNTLEEVEEFLRQRDSVRGYTRVM